MCPVILLWCWVHPKHRVMLRPWPVVVWIALSSLWNQLNHKAKWEHSLTDTAINNHGVCWVDCSQFGVNGVFVIMPWYLTVIQTLNKYHSAGKIPGMCFFTGGNSWRSLSSVAAALRAAWWALSSRAGIRSAHFPFCQSVLLPELMDMCFLHTTYFNKK